MKPDAERASEIMRCSLRAAFANALALNLKKGRTYEEMAASVEWSETQFRAVLLAPNSLTLSEVGVCFAALDTDFDFNLVRRNEEAHT